jgi:hypothetical protein
MVSSSCVQLCYKINHHTCFIASVLIVNNVHQNSASITGCFITDISLRDKVFL